MDEKEAIKILNRRINQLRLKFAITNEDLEAIETVLNLLEKKDITIIETKEANRQLSVELQKKYKIIDEMTYYLSNFDIDEMCEKCDRCIGNGCYADDDMEFKINCIKQYFERRIE